MSERVSVCMNVCMSFAGHAGLQQLHKCDNELVTALEDSNLLKLGRCWFLPVLLRPLRHPWLADWPALTAVATHHRQSQFASPSGTQAAWQKPHAFVHFFCSFGGSAL